MKKLDMNWSLSELYSGFESKEYLDDLLKLKELFDEVEKWEEKELKSLDNSKEKIEMFIDYNIKLRKVSGKISAYSRLKNSADSSNDIAKKEMSKVNNIMSNMTKVNVKFTKWISKINGIDEIIKQSSIIEEHKFIIKEMIKKESHMLSEHKEIILSKMSLTGSNSWMNLRNELTANHMVEIDLGQGIQRKSINEVKNLLYSKDKNEREKAFYSELESNRNIEIGVAAALNGLKGEVLTLCDIKGYSSPLEKTLIDSRMDEEILNNMLQVIEESLPKFREYFLKKSKLLGNEGKMPMYDRLAPVGKNNKKYTYEGAMEFIVKHFSSFSSNMSELAKTAFENRWIDAEQRGGKRGGAFCSNLHCIGQSRILSSFNGNFKNVNTLAHELGHAYHGYILSNESILNTSYTMPLAETASIFAETLVVNAALKEANKEETISILDAELTNASTVIVDIYARFLFEKEFFNKRKQGELSANEIKKLMIWAQKESYGDAIEENTFDPYAWIHKVHYYYAERNFYNFPYAFGLLFSKGLYSEYLKDGKDFVLKYDNILRLTGKANVYDVGKYAGIDLHSKKFWRDSMEIVNKTIDKFLEIK